jgi:hypothetical protein
MNRGRVGDLAFLTTIVFASVVPYVWRVGFYSDDWSTLGPLVNLSDQSLSGLAEALYDFHYKHRMRPTQLALDAVLFKAFGLDPLGYHIVNAVVLASLALLLYLIIRELGAHRAIAVAVAAVYVLLPNYSTDRFWYAAFGYTLTTAFMLGSTYAFLRSTRGRRPWRWAVPALLALAVAGLGMEVVMPLTLLIPVAVWMRSGWFASNGLRAQLGTRQTIALLSSPVLLVAAVALLKAAVSEAGARPGVFYVARLAIGSLAVNFGTFGIALPHTIAWSFSQLPWSAAVLGGAVGIAVFSYLARIAGMPDGPRVWARVVLAGAVVFGLGIVIFLVTPQILFWSTGIANRIWIAAALGVAPLLVGASGWVTARLPIRAKRWAFAAMISILCVSGFVINTAISTYWVAAWPRQLQVLADLRRALPQLPSGTTVILDGVCPYIGPAIVFESPWDLQGALQTVYRDPSLRADVATGHFSVGADGLSTQIYDMSMSYEYGPDLVLFNHQQQKTVWLTDAETARTHFATRTACPESSPGRGTVALPFDVWFRNAEVKGFRPWR